MSELTCQEVQGVEHWPYTASAEALFEMGLVCSLGGHGAPDLVAAHAWLYLAAIKGSVHARVCRRELAREMSPEQIAAAQRKAAAWIVPHM